MSGAEFARFARDLARSASGIDRKARRAIDRVGRGALKAAESIVPEDEGDLRESLTLKVKGTVATVETSLYYGAFQEFGTSQMAPNPFIGPSAVTWGEALVREVEGIADDVARELL